MTHAGPLNSRVQTSISLFRLLITTVIAVWR